MSSIKFYVPVGYGQVLVSSVTDTFAGSQYNKYHLLDGHLNPTWKALNNTPGKSIIVKFTASTPPAWDTFGIWLTNYNTVHTTMLLDVYWSDNGTDWTLLTGDIAIDNTDAQNDRYPLWYQVIQAPVSVTAVWWKFTLTTSAPSSVDLPAIPNFGEIFLMKEYETTTAGEYPLSDLPEFMNTEFKARDGSRHFVADARQPVIHFERNIMTFDNPDTSTTNAALIQAVYEACRGSLLYFIYNEGDTIYDAYVCRFDKDMPEWQDLEFEVRRYLLNFTSLPYVADGSTY